MTTLPPSVLNAIGLEPIEDIALHLLRARFPDLQVGSLISDDQTFPFMLVRRDGDWGAWSGDSRFLDAGQLSVHTFAAGIDSDVDAAKLGWAAEVALRSAINVVVPGLGHLTKARMTSAPARKTDWATATGPVQYADLPTGVSRYETGFFLEMKKPATSA